MRKDTAFIVHVDGSEKRTKPAVPGTDEAWKKDFSEDAGMAVDTLERCNWMTKVTLSMGTEAF